MKFKILTIMIVILYTSCNIENSYPKADWTLMFYLADDYQTLNLTNDILELTKNEVTTNDIRIIILYDGPEAGDSRLEVLDSPFTMYSRVIQLNSTSIKTDSDGEIDMADQTTLESYISYVKNTIPSEKYALYFGSHGTGYRQDFLSGLAVEKTGTTMDEQSLTISEISSAIKNTNGINLITFDACNIGNIETIYEFKDSGAEYIIASPELIPGPGNDYIGFVQAAYSLTDLTTLSLGKATLESHYNYYSTLENEQTMGSPYYHEAKSLQQLYNVNDIINISDSDEFKSELITFKIKNTSNVTKFNGYSNHSDIYDLMTDPTIFDDAIVIADKGIYKWISIFIPNTDYFDANIETSAYESYTHYEKSKFAIDNPKWTNILRTQ